LVFHRIVSVFGVDVIRVFQFSVTSNGKNWNGDTAFDWNSKERTGTGYPNSIDRKAG